MTGVERASDNPDAKAWYLEYLASPHWQETRQRKLDETDHRCQRCKAFPRRGLRGVEFGLHVHHRNYDRVGVEKMDDLEVLCEACHQIEHGLIDDTQQARDRVLARQSARIAALTTGYTEDDITGELEQWDQLATRAGL